MSEEKMSEKEMTDRYIYEVTRRVPQKMREEIALELQALIEDMCKDEDTTVEEVLKKLGDPKEFAKRYRDTPNYLIGPEYYDNYVWILKLALIGVSISAVVSAIVNGIIKSGGRIGFFARFLSELIESAVTGACCAVGIVTIIFAVMEWKKVKVSIKSEKKWTVDDLTKNSAYVKSWTPHSLPPVPDKRAVIKRADSVVSVIFITVLATLLLAVPELFGALDYADGQLISISCVFNLKEWSVIAPILIFSLFVGLLDEIIRLVTGYYCKLVMYSSIVCGAIQIVCSAILLKLLPFWNQEFAEQVLEYTKKSRYGSHDVLNLWGSDTFSNYILAGCCLIFCLEIGVAVYKTIRYSK